MKVCWVVSCIVVLLVTLVGADSVPTSPKKDQTDVENDSSAKKTESLTTPSKQGKNIDKKEKGNTGNLGVTVKKHETDTEESVDDDLQYLAAADQNHKGSGKSAKGTTQTDESDKSVSDTTNKETEQKEDDEGDEDTEEENEDVNQEEDEEGSLSDDEKEEKVLARGGGQLGDLMFQYATVSSIARSSRRRAIFSDDFVPMLTLFPNAPIVIIEDDDIARLQPLVNITLTKTDISFDSVKQDIPEHASVEVVGQTRSFKYFHVIMNSLQNEFKPSAFYISAADDYLEEVMRRALKNELKGYVDEYDKEKKDDKTNGVALDGAVDKSKGFIPYGPKKDINENDKPKDNDKDEENSQTFENVKDKLRGTSSTKHKTQASEKLVEDVSVETKTTPRSLVEKIRSPYEKITLVGIHVPAILAGDVREVEEHHEETSEKAEETPREKMSEEEKTVLSYYSAAMQYYRDEHSISGDFVQFVIVCEDLRWCIDHLNGPGVHFAIGGSQELDLNILAQCDHAVLTSSSMSWWSAWMTGGQVVFPASMPELNGVPLQDYVLPDWTEIYN